MSLSLRAGCLQVTFRRAQGLAQPRAGLLLPLGPLALSPPACSCGDSRAPRPQGWAGRQPALPWRHAGPCPLLPRCLLCGLCLGPWGLWAWWAAGRSLLGLARASGPGDSKQRGCLQQSQAGFQETAASCPLPAGGAPSHATAGCGGCDPGQGRPLVAARDRTSCSGGAPLSGLAVGRGVGGGGQAQQEAWAGPSVHRGVRSRFSAGARPGAGTEYQVSSDTHESPTE